MSSKGTSKTRLKSKIVNPFNRKEYDVRTEEGQRLLKLVKACKKCNKDEIYDHKLFRCVKRTTKNINRLKEFDRFCIKYKKQKIREKGTEEIALGKLLKLELPGGKLENLIGKTKAKEILIAAQKKAPFIKKIATYGPIILAVSSVLLLNPVVYPQLKKSINDIVSQSATLTKIFGNFVFRKTDEAFSGIKTTLNTKFPDNLAIKVNKDDLLTKDAIRRYNVGTMISDSSAKVNTKVLGVYGITEYLKLDSYTLVFDGSDLVVPKFVIKSSSVSGDKTILNDIIVINVQRRQKIDNITKDINNLAIDIKNIEQSEKAFNNTIVLLTRQQNKSIELIETNNELEKIQNTRKPVKVIESKINKIKKDLASIQKDIEIQKLQDKFFIHSSNRDKKLTFLQKIKQSIGQVNIILKDLSIDNVNAMAQIISPFSLSIKEYIQNIMSSP